jgi:hypothetical protein
VVTARCESREFGSGLPCKRTAIWLVQVGTRKADAQRCCPQHLNMAMLGNETMLTERTVALTVTAVTS